MGEGERKFIPQSLDVETGQMKPIPPEELARMKEEQRALERREKSSTIRLKPDATFGDLFATLEEIEGRLQESEEEGDFDDPTHFMAELLDNFDSDVLSEIENFKAKLEDLRLKRPEEYTEEERELVNLKVLPYFESKGYSMKDVETFLPIKFKKGRRKK